MVAKRKAIPQREAGTDGKTVSKLKADTKLLPIKHQEQKMFAAPIKTSLGFGNYSLVSQCTRMILHHLTRSLPNRLIVVVLACLYGIDPRSSLPKLIRGIPA